MMLFIKRHYSEAEMKRLAYYGIIIFEANIVSNIFVYHNIGAYTNWSYVAAAKMPTLVRQLNLGSTPFATSVLLFTGIVLSLFICEKDRNKKYLWLMFSLTGVYYTAVCSGRASNLLLLVLMVFLFVINYNKKISGISSVVLVACFIAIWVFNQTIIDVLISIIPNQRIAVRLEAISRYLQGADDGGLYLDRIRIIQLSIETWLSGVDTFLFGIGDKRYLAGNLSEIYTLGISGHSDYLDTLARYGLLGFTLLNALLLSIINYTKKSLSIYSRWSRFTLIIYVILFARSIVGAIFSMNIAFIVFILLPISRCLISIDKTVEPR
jgi:hypothetical protein